MSVIDVKIDADDSGGSVRFSIDKAKISLAKMSGPHEVRFKLDDKTKNGPAVFDQSDPIFYSENEACPKSGHDSNQISVDSCSDRILVITDTNDGPARTIGYQLNFLYAGAPAELDPIIINGGSV